MGSQTNVNYFTRKVQYEFPNVKCYCTKLGEYVFFVNTYAYFCRSECLIHAIPYNQNSISHFVRNSSLLGQRYLPSNTVIYTSITVKI